MRARIRPLVCTPTPLQSLLARRWRPQWVCSHRRLQRRAFTATTSSKDNIPEKPYYATTPIFYVNAAPHVGHMYTLILTDVLKRWQQLHNRRSILCTGTDEHGLKIQRAAAQAGVEPTAFCDKGADVFKDLASRIGISNDIFIRTTDAKHREAVEYAWQMLESAGYIYESRHEGWYSVSDETFYPSSGVHAIVDPPTGRKIMVSIETGKEVEWTSERNYHFRLSTFRDRLLHFYAQNPTFIVPKVRMHDVVREVTAGLEDLSVSRPVERLTWGIRVPSDASQTMYVWLDALLNYATAAGYPFTPGFESAGGWPADLHVIGKDIVRFHCIYWPAFLMALNLPLPKQVLTHAHWTLGKQKMAKSTGNVVNPFFALERFGVDAMRWYLIHDGGIESDADYDNRFIIDKYKKSLQGGLGNLASRVMRAKNWNVRGAVQYFASSPAEANAATFIHDSESKNLYTNLLTLPQRAEAHMRDLRPNKALQKIMRAVYDANAYMQATEPWSLASKLRTRGNSAESVGRDFALLQARLDMIVYLNAETLRLVGIMLQPFMPDAAGRLLDMLGVEPARRNWEWSAFGADGEYGIPLGGRGIEEGVKGMLFPGLTSAF